MQDHLIIGRRSVSLTGGMFLSEFSLPLSSINERFGVAGISGSGKSILTAGMAEQMCKTGQPWIAFDPAGNWWGLRVMKDGKTPGHAVLVIGGHRGDLPLDPDAGARYAKVVMDTPVPVVFDLTKTRGEPRYRFMFEFFSKFHDLSSDPEAPGRHVFLEEAKDFAPQQLPSYRSASLCRNALEEFATEARNHGIGYTVLTQRPAMVSKSVWSQVGSMFLLQVRGTNDIKAIGEWMDSNGPEIDRKDFARELARLPSSEAFYVNPGNNPPVVRVKVNDRETLHPSEVKKVNPGMLQRATLADVGRYAEKLAREMGRTQVAAAAPSKVKETYDPFGLKLGTKKAGRKPMSEDMVERRDVRPSDARAQELEEEVRAMTERLDSKSRELDDALQELAAMRVREVRIKKFLQPQYDSLKVVFESVNGHAPATVDAEAWAPWLVKAGKKGTKRLLELLMQRPGGLLMSQLLTLAALKPVNGSSTTRRYLGWLRSNNLIVEEGDRVTLASLS